MKKRGLVMMIVLSIVTFGIYAIVWQCMFQNELKKTTNEGFGWLGHLLMTMFTFGIYAIYWQFAAGKRLAKAGCKSDYAIIYLILSLVGFGVVNMFLMQHQANEIAA